MKTPINMKALRQHFTYSFWKYVLLAALAILGWNLIYTVTQYQPPAEKCVDLYIFGVGEDELLDTYMEHVRTTEMSDMEQMESTFFVVDPAYTAMQLTTYIAAGDGDFYILPKDYFQNYAAQEMFVPLENIPGLTEGLTAAGISFDRGWRIASESGEKHLYGIPMADFPGLAAYSYGHEDSYLCLSVTNGNEDNCIKFLNIFLRDMLEPPIVMQLPNE